MEITDEQLSEIAQDIESGMKVFINRKDLKIKTILDYDDFYGDSEFWEKEEAKIENEWTDYAVITKMDSSEAYRIMEDFVDEIDDKGLQENLIKILDRKSPFANFKAEIDTSQFRDKWFEFKHKKYKKYVRDLLEIENFDIE
ncbi:hypothetical protein J7K93_11105 [bacterium]|nr:hypothetical protein [bacterium]